MQCYAGVTNRMTQGIAPMMSMTIGDELGKSDVFVKFAVMLSPLIEEAVRQGITMNEFERRLFGGLLCTGKQVIDQFLIAQGDGDVGETAAHPDDSSNGQTTESRKIHRSPDPAARKLRTVFGEHKFSAYVYREGDDRRSPIVRRPVDERLGISGDRYSPVLQEYSMLFYCEQAFHGAVDSFNVCLAIASPRILWRRSASGWAPQRTSFCTNLRLL